MFSKFVINKNNQNDDIEEDYYEDVTTNIVDNPKIRVYFIN